MKFIVDRIEENFAVCEDDNKNMINIELCKLPKNIKEGDVIMKDDNSFYIDYEATKKAKEEIEKLVESLWDE